MNQFDLHITEIQVQENSVYLEYENPILNNISVYYYELQIFQGICILIFIYIFFSSSRKLHSSMATGQATALQYLLLGLMSMTSGRPKEWDAGWKR